jgi:hypothetical protein
MATHHDPDRTDPATAEADRADAATGPGADRPPTPDEAAAAEEAAAALEGDLPEIESHFREMTRIGAEVQGEGEIPG